MHIYQHDIENRYPSHTLTRVTKDDLVTFELKDAESKVIARARAMTDEDALAKMRAHLLGAIHMHVTPVITTAQKNGLTDITNGQRIFEIGASELTYNGTAWV